MAPSSTADGEMPNTPKQARTSRLSITDLSPDINNQNLKAIDGVVSLIWPYSSLTNSTAILLADPDFRLRTRKGQTKVTFHGPSAVGTAQSHVGIGDVISLNLEGASWTQADKDISVVGKRADWDLVFEERVYMEIHRGGILLATVDVSFSAEPVKSPLLEIAANDRLQTGPQVLRSSQGAWSSPGFAQQKPRQFDRLYLNDEDDGSSPTRANKRTKFSRDSGSWRFVEISPIRDVENVPPHSPQTAANGTQEMTTAFESEEAIGAESDGPRSGQTANSSVQQDQSVDASVRSDEGLVVSVPPPEPDAEHHEQSPSTNEFDVLMDDSQAAQVLGTNDEDVVGTTSEASTPRLQPLNSEFLPPISPLLERKSTENGVPPTVDSSHPELDLQIRDSSPEVSNGTHSDPIQSEAQRDMAAAQVGVQYPPAITLEATSQAEEEVVDLVSPTIDETEMLAIAARSALQETGLEEEVFSEPPQSAPVFDAFEFINQSPMEPHFAPLETTPGSQPDPPEQSENAGDSESEHDLVNVEEAIAQEEITDLDDDEAEASAGDESSSIQRAESEISTHTTPPDEQKDATAVNNTFKVPLQKHSGFDDDVQTVSGAPLIPDSAERDPASEPQTYGQARITSYDGSEDGKDEEGGQNEGDEKDEEDNQDEEDEEDNESVVDLHVAELADQPTTQKGPAGRTTLRNQLVTPDNTQEMVDEQHVHEKLHETQLGVNFPLSPQPSQEIPTSQRTLEETRDSQEQALASIMPPETPRQGAEHEVPAKSSMLKLSAEIRRRRRSTRLASTTPLLAKHPSEIVSPYFTPRTKNKASLTPSEDPPPSPPTQTPTRKVESQPMPTSTAPAASEPEGRTLRPRKQADQADAAPMKPAAATKRPGEAQSLTTPHSYYTGLRDVPNLFSVEIDILAVVSSPHKSVERAKAGPKDYFVTLKLVDRSCGSEDSVSAEILRPYKTALPSCQRGDVVLLRAMKVQTRRTLGTREKKDPDGDSNVDGMMLLSTDSSSWAVFKFPRTHRRSKSNSPALNGSQATNPVQINGPPVEFGLEERVHADGLYQWWRSTGQETFPAVAATPSPKNSAKTTKPRLSLAAGLSLPEEAKQSIHEHNLRDGRAYGDTISPSPLHKHKKGYKHTRSRSSQIMVADRSSSPAASPVASSDVGSLHEHELRNGMAYGDTIEPKPLPEHGSEFDGGKGGEDGDFVPVGRK